jgi:amidase
MKKAGAEIIDPASVVSAKYAAIRTPVFAWDSSTNSTAYLAAQGDRVPVHNLDEIIKSQKFHPSVQLRLERAQQSTPQGPDSDACKAEMSYRKAFGAAVTRTMDDLKLDAFVYPTWSNPPRLIGDLNTPHGDNSQIFSRPRASPPSTCRWATRARACYRLA